MIAGCIDKVRRRACGDCPRSETCAFGFAGIQAMARFAEPDARAGRHPLLQMLGAVARAVETLPAPAAPAAAPSPTAFRREIEQRVALRLQGGPVRLGEIAQAMRLSRQTLYRRLKVEGTTFEALVDGERRRLALELIGEEAIAIKDLAYRLGFSDPAAFSRAFKRWTGFSPREYRRRRLH